LSRGRCGRLSRERKQHGLDGGRQRIFGEARSERYENSHSPAGWVLLGSLCDGFCVFTENEQKRGDRRRYALVPTLDEWRGDLRGWDDESSVRILRSCREAMPDHGRVLVCEIVVEPGKPVGHPHRLIDLEMMVTLGGKERTAEEYKRLMDAAGLKLERVTPIENSFVAVVEASPRA
jgi:hypothetical protein